MWTAIRFSQLMFILCGLLYPLTMTGLGQALFPAQANGSLIRNAQGQVIGSELLGQNFTKPEYFHPRPAPNGYDAANSSGSNLGPTSQKLIDRIKTDAATYQKENPTATTIPVDAVTASGSNLDPHISLANALAQTPRIAAARRKGPAALASWVRKQAESSPLAEAPYVNVLKLNMALDAQK